MWLTVFIAFIHGLVGFWLYKRQETDELKKERKWRERYHWRD
jgi:hypothetical protein